MESPVSPTPLRHVREWGVDGWIAEAASGRWVLLQLGGRPGQGAELQRQVGCEADCLRHPELLG